MFHNHQLTDEAELGEHVTIINVLMHAPFFSVMKHTLFFFFFIDNETNYTCVHYLCPTLETDSLKKKLQTSEAGNT